MPRESFQAMVARINASAYLPGEPLTGGTSEPQRLPTGSGSRKMAKVVKLPKNVKEFSFATTGGSSQASKYPWDEWFNGDLLLLERHDGPEDDKGTIADEKATTKRDYGVQTDAMPAKIKTAARRRYKVVQISRRDADGKKLTNGIIIKARDMDATERQQEDLLRAEEKAALKAKKDEAKAAANGPPVVAQDGAVPPA